MAALNQQETKALREAIATIEGVLRNGFDREFADANPGSAQAIRKVQLKEAKAKIDTVVQMKGYYPK